MATCSFLSKISFSQLQKQTVFCKHDREVTRSEESSGMPRGRAAASKLWKWLPEIANCLLILHRVCKGKQTPHVTSRNIIAWICELCDRFGAHKDFYFLNILCREKEIWWQKILHEPLLFIVMCFKLSPVTIRNIDTLQLCLFITFVGMGQNTTP